MSDTNPDMNGSHPQASSPSRGWEEFSASLDISDIHRPRLDEVLTVMLTIEEEPEHVAQVARLAGSLFKQAAHLHGYGEEENLWLVAAALLHDTGWAITPDGSKHHKYSQQFILETTWKSFSAREKAIIANVARYHRKALPSEAHPHFHPLSPADKKTVEILAAFLRLGDALDRTHLQIVRSVRLLFEPKQSLLLIDAKQHPEAEISAVERKKDLFELVFRSKLRGGIL